MKPNKQTTTQLSQINLIVCVGVILINLLVLLSPVWCSSLSVLLLIMAFDIIALRLTNIHWHLVHEAVHRILFPSSRLNEKMGQLLSVLFFTGFTIIRFGHLVHHKTNRYEDLTEVYDTGAAPNLAYYGEILGGFFIVAEFIAPCLCLLPRTILLNIAEKIQSNHPEKEVMLQSFIRLISQKQKFHRARLETLMQILLFGLTLFIFQHHLILFLFYFLFRATLVSYYNNMPHYENSVRLDINAAENSYLPPLLSRTFLNFNYHRIHHEYPLLPWIDLPQKFNELEYTYDNHFLEHFFSQLKGPIHIRHLEHDLTEHESLNTTE